MDPNTCPICRDEIDFYSYGKCDHPTCIRCAVKLRRFGNLDDPNFSSCATCRARLSRIIIMEKFKPFDSVDMSTLLPEAELDFQFENDTVLRFYKKLIACVCSTCGCVEKNMAALNRHTTNEHGLSFCDLCLRHAHMLPSEFVPLSPKDLVLHRKWDKVKKRGHPVCEFCSETFYEFENLVTHIKEVHFLCDFCHTVGVFEVFRHQRELFGHYKAKHFVCPECEMTRRMTCFPSEDQLGIHRMREHPLESREDPTLWAPLQIRYSTEGLIGPHYRGRREHNIANQDVGGSSAQPRAPMPEEWTSTDFPSLAGDSCTNDNVGSSNTANADGQRPKSTGGERHCRSHAAVVSGAANRGNYATFQNSDDFPSLPSSSVSSKPPTNQPPAHPKWVDVKETATTPSTSKSFDRNKIPTTTLNRDDFPRLAGSFTTTNHASPANWGTVANKSNDKTKLVEHKTVADDFPPLASTTSSSFNKHRILPEARLSSYVPPSSKPKTEKTRAKNGKTKVVEPPLPSAPDMEPFSSALLKAKKSSWWNMADNDGAVSRLHNAVDREEGRICSNIQTVDRPDAINASMSASSIPTPPPTFSSQDFPALGESVKKKSTVRNTLNISITPTRSSAIKSTVSASNKGRKKPTPEIQTTTPGTKSKKQGIDNNSDPTGTREVKILDNVEDTETVLYAKNVYTPPADYEARNHAVIAEAERVFTGEGRARNAFNRFANLSRLFRHGQLPANSYLEALDSLLSFKPDAPQTDWLSSMLALLPDVGLQRALLRAMKGEAAPRVPYVATPARCRGKSPPPWARSVAASLQICSVCGQVCQRSDMREHAKLIHG